MEELSALLSIRLVCSTSTQGGPPTPPCFVNGFASYSKACAGGLSITASFHYTSLVGSVLATVAASPTAAV